MARLRRAWISSIVTNLNNFGERRGSTHIHEGVDMMGPKMTPLYAVVDGRVKYLNFYSPKFLLISSTSCWGDCTIARGFSEKICSNG